jgi:hypothetical protein
MKKLRLEVIESLAKHFPRNVRREIFSLIDEIYMTGYNITQEEFCYICSEVTIEERDIMNHAIGLESEIPTSFTTRKLALQIRNKYLENFHQWNN